MWFEDGKSLRSNRLIIIACQRTLAMPDIPRSQVPKQFGGTLARNMAASKAKGRTWSSASRSSGIG